MELIERASGNKVEVPEEQVQSAFASGKYGVPQGTNVGVRTAGGAIGTVAAKDTQAAFDAGQRVASKEQIQEAEMEARYGSGLGNTAAAGGLGILKGASEAFGLPFEGMASNIGDLASIEGARGYTHVDPITGRNITESVGEHWREAMGQLAERHAVASGVGQVIGTTAAALTGQSAMGALGELAERGAAGIAGKGILSGAARGAAEMGAYSGIQAVDEAALGNTDLTSEKVISAIGHGALIGGLTGGAFAGIGKGRDLIGRFRSAVKPADIEALAASQFGEAAPGLGSLYAKAASAASGADLNAVNSLTKEAFNPFGAGAEARRIAVYDSEEIQNQAARSIREAGDNMLAADRLIADEARGTLKADYVRKAIQTGNEGAVKSFAAAKIDEILKGADDMLTNGGGFTKSIEHVSQSAYKALEDIEVGDNAKTFMALDSLKRDVQKLTRNAFRGVNAMADPIDQRAARQTAEWLQQAGESVRTGLEDENLFGKAATDQQTINQAWSKQIDASTRFHRALTTEVGRDPSNPFLDVKGMDPSKVTNYVRNLVNPDKDLIHQSVKDYIQGSRDLASAISTSYDLPAEKLAEVARLHEAANAFESHVNKGSESLVLANQFKALREADSPMGGALSLAGGVFGGPLGALAGAGMSAFTNPAKTVSQLAAVERLVRLADEKMDLGLERFFKGGAKGKSGSVEALGGASQRKTFEQSVEHVREMSANPDLHAERLGNALAPISRGAPNTATNIATKAAGMTSYLATNAPSMHSGTSLWPEKEKPVYSDTEMRSWARRAAVVNDPTTVMHSLAKGTLSSEEVDAFRTQYPALFVHTQEKIMDRLREHELPREKRLMLGILFSVPTEPDLTQPSIAMMQQSYGPPPKSPTQGKSVSTLHVSAPFMTSSQRVQGIIK